MSVGSLKETESMEWIILLHLLDDRIKVESSVAGNAHSAGSLSTGASLLPNESIYIKSTVLHIGLRCSVLDDCSSFINTDK